jgi:hypothetical protein
VASEPSLAEDHSLVQRALSDQHQQREGDDGVERRVNSATNEKQRSALSMSTNSLAPAFGSLPSSFETSSKVATDPASREDDGGATKAVTGLPNQIISPPVSSVMMPPPATVRCDVSVEKAIAILDKKPRRSCLLVDNGAGLELGIVTWSDLVAALDSLSLAVGEVQSRPLITICPKDLTTMAAELMDKLQVLSRRTLF